MIPKNKYFLLTIEKDLIICSQDKSLRVSIGINQSLRKLKNIVLGRYNILIKILFLMKLNNCR